MKKRFVLASLMLAFIMCIMPNVYAESPDSITKLDELENCLNGENPVCTLTDDIKDLSTYITITKDVTINLNGHNITRTSGTVLYVNNGGKLTLTGDGIVKSDITNNAPVYVQNNSTLDVKGNAKIENDNNGFAIIGESSTINISENSSIINNGTGTGISIRGESSKLNITGGTVNATGDAITVFGNNPIVKITGGNITSQNGFALSGNGSQTTNSTINISGGNITSDSLAAIYQPQSGNLTITNGNITGKIGIVARQGNTTITGGKITATGKEDLGIGDSGNKFPGGVAVVVDNTTKTAKATIGGSAIINATNENPILAYGDENNENNSIVVNAGVKFTGTDPKDVYLAKGLIVDENGKVVDSSSVKPENNTKNPNTSDAIIYSVIAIVISALGLTFVYRKLHNN